MAGGPSQVDTFDMKPGTSSAGEFRPIATNVPGIQICEHLPRLAQHMDKLAVVRGMSTSEADHVRGSYLMQTGYRQVPSTSHPHIGSIASAEIGQPNFELPNFFWLGGRSNADAGFLGARHGLVHIPQIHDERARNLENARARPIRRCPNAGPLSSIGSNNDSIRSNMAPRSSPIIAKPMRQPCT